MDTQAIALSQTPSNAAVSSTLTGDFQTFLKMLTTQMQHQDPLEPMAASDFAVQLATFTSVEQQVITNQNLTSIGQQLGMMSMAQLAGWVGHDAQSTGPVWFDGSSVDLTSAPHNNADRAILSVRDTAGNLLVREEVPTTPAFIWSGLSANGAPLPQDHYTLSLESWRNEELLSEDPVAHYAKVIEARGGADGTRLVLAGGREVDATTISALRLAQP